MRLVQSAFTSQSSAATTAETRTCSATPGPLLAETLLCPKLVEARIGDVSPGTYLGFRGYGAINNRRRGLRHRGRSAVSGAPGDFGYRASILVGSTAMASQRANGRRHLSEAGHRPGYPYRCWVSLLQVLQRAHLCEPPRARGLGHGGPQGRQYISPGGGHRQEHRADQGRYRSVAYGLDRLEARGRCRSLGLSTARRWSWRSIIRVSSRPVHRRARRPIG